MFFLTGSISHLLSFKMRLQNFDHLVEENLGYPVSFVVVQEWVEVQFARYILDFLSRKSGPNVYHQSQVYYKIVGRKKKISSSQTNRISIISILLLASHIIRYIDTIDTNIPYLTSQYVKSSQLCVFPLFPVFPRRVENVTIFKYNSSCWHTHCSPGQHLH